MSLIVEFKNDWVYIPAPGRWDAFNFDTSKVQLETVSHRNKLIAIDVSEAHFISIPMMKLLQSIAEAVVRRGGRLALVGSTEKFKRQLHIFASLTPFTLYTQAQWQTISEMGSKSSAPTRPLEWQSSP